MSGTFSALFVLSLTALGARACERLPWLRRRSWAVGLVFGLLAVVSDLCACRIGGWRVLVSCVMPLVAVLYFSSAAGLVSAAVTGVWAFFGYRYLLMSAGTVGSLVWMVTPLVVALYAVAVRKWYFFSRRPAPLPAAIVAMFGLLLQKSIESGARSEALSVVVEVAHRVLLPELVASAVLAALVAVMCGQGRAWRRNFLSGHALSLILFSLGFGLMSWFVIAHADRQTDAAVQDAQRRLEHDLDDQLGFMLHCNASLIVKSLGSATNSNNRQVSDCLTTYDIDTLELVDRNGVITVSNEPQLSDPMAYFKSPYTREFLVMTNGAVPFVKQRFRGSTSNSRQTKYIGVPFPDGSGFIQLGYLRTRMERDFSKFFFPMLADMTVGKSGYYLVADRRRGTVACGTAGRPEVVGKPLAEIGLSRPAVAEEDHSRPFDACVFGRICRCCDTHIGDWCVYSVVPLADAYGPALLGLLFAGVLLLAVCTVFRVVVFRFKLAQSKIDTLRAREDERREKDLKLARTIQHSALPSRFPDEPGYGIAARMDAAKEVGGDFYDFFTLSSGEIGFLIADVSGKSIPGAMFMMQAKMVLRSCLFSLPDLAAAVAEANRRLCEHNEAEMFVTVWAGVWDRSTGRVRYVNAGHNPPLVKHADGRIEWLRARPGMPLAAIEIAKYRVESLELKAGDTLFLYTDGVTEANNVAMELYGEARLETAFAAAGADCVGAVRADVDRFVVGAEQADDITMLALYVKGRT